MRPQILTAFKAFLRAAGYFSRTGRLFVSPVDSANRLKVCMACPYRVRIAGVDQCGICTCIIKAKIEFITEACPKNLWPR